MCNKLCLLSSTLVLTVVVLLFGSLKLGAQAASSTNDLDQDSLLRQLCQKKQTIQVESIGQVDSFARALKTGQDFGCTAETKLAIYDLAALITSKDVCSPDHVDEIGRFYLEFIRKRAEFRRHLPKPLRQTFLAYGFQLSKLCKQSLAGELARATEMLPADDFELIAGAEVGEKYQTLVGEPLQMLDLVAFVDSRGLLKRAQKFPKKLAVAVSRQSKEMIERLQGPCANRLKPIYDRLFVPIIKLTGLGFDYNDTAISELMASPSVEHHPAYPKWLQAVFVCETVVRASAIDAAEIGEPANERQSVLMLPEDELIELERKLGKELERAQEDSKAIVFERSGVSLDWNKPLAGQDEYLAQLIKDFGGKRGVAKENQKKAAKRLKKLLRAYFKQNTIKFGLGKRTKKSPLARGDHQQFGHPLYGQQDDAILSNQKFLTVVYGLIGATLAAAFVGTVVLLAIHCPFALIALFLMAVATIVATKKGYLKFDYRPRKVYKIKFQI